MARTDPFFRRLPIFFEYAALAGLLPLVLIAGRRRAAVRRLSGRSAILLQLALASLGLFSLAHLLLFRLYLPSRYVKYSVPLVLAIAAGLALVILIEAAAEGLPPRGRRLAAVGLPLMLGAGLAIYPGHYDADLRRDTRPGVTTHLRSVPKDALIAGVPLDTDQVPYFARRRVLASRAHAAFPYRVGYYGEIRQRLEALIQAYYAESADHVAEFAARYQVDFFLVDRRAFDRRTLREAWAGGAGSWEPFSSAAERRFRQGRSFALLELARTCAAMDDGVVAVVPTTCLGRGG